MRGVVMMAVLLMGMGGARAAEGQDGVTMRLWAGEAPGAKGTAPVDVPRLTAYVPAANPTKTAVVVAPGGGYVNLAMDHEGLQIARWLNAHGVAAFVLEYRLGPKYHAPVELEDAQRALRTVRANAAKYGVATDHLGMWGFSAGGHLTATAGTKFDGGKAGAADPVERVSSRPDFLILAYPVITMESPLAHTGSRRALLGDHPTAAEEAELSAEKHVTKQTPPTFLFSTTDDDVVPVMNSVLFYSALVRAKVPAEMHLFPHGRHGLGLAQNEFALRHWPELLAVWMEDRGYMAKANGGSRAPAERP